jgi:hypothetical protein
VQKEVRRIYYTHPRSAYFLDFTNVFEVFLLVANLVAFITYAAFQARGLAARPLDVNDDAYVDLYDSALMLTYTFNWAGIVGLLCAIKAFRYLAISKRMNTLWLTVHRAGTDLAAFIAALFICLCGFAFMGEQVFG